MLHGGPIILAALTAAVTAAGGAIGKRRPDFVPSTAPAFYWYCAMYFILGGLVMWIAQDSGFIGLRFPDDSQHVLALGIGIAIRPLLQMKLFSVRINNQVVDVGFSALIAPFEGVLLNAITLHRDDEVRRFLAPYEETFSDLRDVKKRIENHLPDTLKTSESRTLLKRAAAATTPAEAMEIYLRLVGKAVFKRTFRLPQPRSRG
jgi:hypothetical protein